jgi:hypothetical protein
VLLGAVSAILVAPVAVAHADDNALRATLNSYSTKIANDENAVSHGVKVYMRHGKWSALVRAYNREVPVLRALRANLLQDQASTIRGAKAKTDLVKGLRLKASAMAALSRILRAARGGTLPKAETVAAVREGNAGAALIRTGLRLLK